MASRVAVGDWVEPNEAVVGKSFGAWQRWPQRVSKVAEDSFAIESDHGLCTRSHDYYLVVGAPSGASTASPPRTDGWELTTNEALARLHNADQDLNLALNWARSTLAVQEDKPLYHGIAQPRPPKDTNPKTVFGQAKPPLGLVPGTAMVFMAEALRDGSDKYGPANWRIDPVSATTYRDACLRHLLAWCDGEDIDPTSKVPHLAHAMTNLAILLDALSCGTLIDDRPPKAPTGDLIRINTRPLERKPTNAPR